MKGETALKVLAFALLASRGKKRPADGTVPIEDCGPPAPDGKDGQILVVANREPYTPIPSVEGLRTESSPSGLVSALDPLLKKASGTWIAQGVGQAEIPELWVPVESPKYLLKRIHLTPEERKGFYDGFSNSSLWPLCHMCFVKPTFLVEDWIHYQNVNAKFADTVDMSMSRAKDSFVFIQDYHFALLPGLLRSRNPGASIALFWHIPWPNHEVMSVCPWLREILEGMIGADEIGFHTEEYGRNFLEAVSRTVPDCSVDFEKQTIRFHGRRSKVRAIPITIDLSTFRSLTTKRYDTLRLTTRERYHLSPNDRMLVGVDRCDYSKGLVEKLTAVREFFLRYPDYVDRVSLVQVAAPTRQSTPEYQEYRDKIIRLTEQINAEIPYLLLPPIQLVTEQLPPEKVLELYAAADICLVTSLHDGMNLVAKEFIATRLKEDGALLLSRFAGAAQELKEATLVNPYHTGEVVEALNRLLNQSHFETQRRMDRLRQRIFSYDLSDWISQCLLSYGQAA